MKMTKIKRSRCFKLLQLTLPQNKTLTKLFSSVFSPDLQKKPQSLNDIYFAVKARLISCSRDIRLIRPFCIPPLSQQPITRFRVVQIIILPSIYNNAVHGCSNN
jgi:hypothetical protein